MISLKHLNTKLILFSYSVFTFSCLSLLIQCSSPASDTGEPTETPGTSVSQSEAPDDWVVLFDGQNLDAWRNYRDEGMGWTIEDGALTTEGGIGDIITKETFDNFELEFEWRISEAGNSGVLYLVQDDPQYEHAHETGPEYQIIDADNFTKKNDYPLDETQKTAANYALHRADGSSVKPLDEYNQGKIIVDDGHVEHWLNGKKVVAYELWTDEWNKEVAQTKFKDMPGYGQSKAGHIALQDHQDRVWFRNIRIRKL